MFVFGSAANADDSNVGGRGKASPSADVAPSFAFDASSLPAVTATPTANSEEATAAGGFKFNVPPTRDLPAAATATAEGGEPGATTPPLQLRQVLGAGVKTEMKHEGRSPRFGRTLKACGACELELPEDSYSGEQWGRRQSIRRCEKCSHDGNQLVLMKRGRSISDWGECPICKLVLPFDEKQTTFYLCCMKEVCNGCVLATRTRGLDDCPFCRTPAPTDRSQFLGMLKRRVDAGDPVAIHHLGCKYSWGHFGLEKDETKAIKLWEHAAELGVKKSHFQLGCQYDEGTGVEKDTAKAIGHWEAAAMCGDVWARFNLGNEEFRAGNYNLALQHWVIAAELGDHNALTNVKDLFMDGLATTADYAEALRGYQSAVEEMQSPQRKEAAALELDAISWRAMGESIHK